MSDPPTSTGTDGTAADWQEALSRHDFELAHKAYLMGEAGQPDVVRALAALAEIQAFVRDKAWTQAQRVLERLEDPPGLLDWDLFSSELDLLSRSSGALDRRDAEGAVELLEQLPSDFFPAEAASQQGTALIFQNRLEEAVDRFREALGHDPKHYRALTNLGNVALEQGQVDEAIDAYNRALALNGEFANAYHNLGVAYRRKGQIGRSVQALKKAQRSLQRRDREEARDILARTSKRQGTKLLRWVGYALVAVVIYFLLRNQGIL